MSDESTTTLRLPCSAVHCLLGTFFMLDQNAPYYRANLRSLVAPDSARTESTRAPEGEVGRRRGGSGKRAEWATARERGGGNRLGPYGVSAAPPGSAVTQQEVDRFTEVLRKIQLDAINACSPNRSRVSHSKAMLSIVRVPFSKRELAISIDALSILLDKLPHPWWEIEIRVVTGSSHAERRWLHGLLIAQ
jgi:hypothetical protein